MEEILTKKFWHFKINDVFLLCLLFSGEIFFLKLFILELIQVIHFLLKRDKNLIKRGRKLGRIVNYKKFKFQIVPETTLCNFGRGFNLYGFFGKCMQFLGKKSPSFSSQRHFNPPIYFSCHNFQLISNIFFSYVSSSN